MKMDEYDGKRFLATVRGDDFAHAGEIESIDLVFESIPTKPDWKVLDVGCGRGGTANYVHTKGWGQVAGIDIDRHSIDYAKERYPALEFQVCAMEEVGARFPEQFDLLYLFNVFYASTEKRLALSSFRKAAKTGGLLCIFDYVYYKPDKPLPAVFLGQTPVTKQNAYNLLKDAYWHLAEDINLDKKYIEWYRNFLDRFDDPELRRGYSEDVINGVHATYLELLNSIEDGVLGGVLLVAQAV